MPSEEISPIPAPEPETSSSRYPYYVLGVLVAVNLFNFVDRQIVSVLLQQIKVDFDVSDEWLGLLTGMAFVVVHSLVGIPIARWADRGTRRNIIALGVAVWSAMTACSGLARSFTQLLILRMGVGIGEAAGTPPSHSMISDYFPPERRARALAIYAVGLYAGIMFGYLAAGWVGQYFGWRTTFVVVGVPGLLLALVVRLTVKEPPRTTSVESHPLGEVVSYLFHRPAYVFVTLAGSFHAIAGYGMAHWAPTFLLRVHEMSYSELGTWLGLITGIAGGAGALSGGILADRFGSGDERWYPWVCAVAALVALPFAAGFLLSDSKWTALAMFAPHIFAIGVYTGPIYAMNQSLAKPRMRATGVAMHLFIVSIVGGGIGPWMIGRLNDSFRAEYGELGIRYSLLIVISCGCVAAAAFYALASRSYREDVAAAQT
jgi:predicted MFS family arabinose efflux permease